MKKIFLLITLLLAAISVAAQSELMSSPGIYASPGKLYSVSSDVYGTTWGQCAGACTNECMEAKQGTREECDKMCFDKCHPQPDVITRKILPTNPAPKPVPVQEDCPTMCKRLTVKGIEVFIRCMHDRCKEDCESSCREMYGSQAQNCIEKFCKLQKTCEQGCDGEYTECMRSNVGISSESIKKGCENVRKNCLQDKCGHPPETCEHGCGRKLDECLKTTVGINIESIRSACKKLNDECVQEQCGKPETCKQGCDKEHQICLEKTVGLNAEGIRAGCDSNRKNCIIKCAPKPVSCEGRCELIRDDCKASHIEPKECQIKIDNCKKNCKPDCPPADVCVNRCTKSYYECDSDRETCKVLVESCLYACHPGDVSSEPETTPITPAMCPERCDRLQDACNLRCTLEDGHCKAVCRGVPNSEACNDNCETRRNACRSECGNERWDCRGDCRRASETLDSSGQTAESAPVTESNNGPGESQAKKGLFARLWSSFTG